MRLLKKTGFCGTALILASALMWNARADTTAVGLDTSWLSGLGRGPAVFGWQFSPRLDITVTSLGLFDTPNRGGFWGDGLLEQHFVGIWNVSEPATPLIVALLLNGTQEQLHDDARFLSIEPLRLTAGSEYVIGALFGDVDPDFGDFTADYFPMVVDPALEFIGRRSGGLRANALVFPELLEAGVAGDFGPNFIFAVPEPAVSGILLLGMLGAAHKLRK